MRVVVGEQLEMQMGEMWKQREDLGERNLYFVSFVVGFEFDGESVDEVLESSLAPMARRDRFGKAHEI